MSADLETLEVRLGHCFTDREILVRALTHSSHVNERLAPGQTPDRRDNEQLEFLGDAVLGLLVSEILVQRFPEAHEGALSQRKAELVSASHLYCVARSLDLGSFLELGRSEEMSGGRSKRTLLSDATEAVIAALYLDGGLGAARNFITTCVFALADDPDMLPAHVPPETRNFKSALQELAQAQHLPQPRYVVVKEHGPEHSKVFTMEARIGKDLSSQATGRTKKLAEQRAARALYEQLHAQTVNNLTN